MVISISSTGPGWIMLGSRRRICWDGNGLPGFILKKSRVLCRSGESQSLRESASREPYECGGLMESIVGCSIARCHDETSTGQSSSSSGRASILRNASEPKKNSRRPPSCYKEMSFICPKRNVLAVWAAGFLIPHEGSTTGRVSFSIYTVLIRKSTPLHLRNTWHVCICTIVNSWHR